MLANLPVAATLQRAPVIAEEIQQLATELVAVLKGPGKPDLSLAIPLKGATAPPTQSKRKRKIKLEGRDRMPAAARTRSAKMKKQG